MIAPVPRTDQLAVPRTDKRSYYRLFTAQALALVSTGVATVALALLAYRLVGADAGAVFGIALAIKMLTYVCIAPLGLVIAARVPRRALLIGLDLLRAGVAVLLPFVTEVWQIYVLIFVFQAASAIFTPTCQALVPELLPEPADYTLALSRSRLMYELEGAVSPAVAAGLLLLLSFAGLFAVTVLGFCVSAALIAGTAIPAPRRDHADSVAARLRRGLALFRTTPRLRALLALNFAVAAATAMVTVNTVVFVQAGLGLSERASAAALVVFGIGSAGGALAMPRLLEAMRDRSAMLGGATLAALALAAGTIVGGFYGLLALWFLLGVGAALAATPAGALLCRSGTDADRPALYVVQFAAANACLLLTYPLAGWAGAEAGAGFAFALFAALAAGAVLFAARVWPHADTAATRPAPSLLEEEYRLGDRA